MDLALKLQTRLIIARRSARARREHKRDEQAGPDRDVEHKPSLVLHFPMLVKFFTGSNMYDEQ